MKHFFDITYQITPILGCFLHSKSEKNMFMVSVKVRGFITYRLQERKYCIY